ncbi:Nucleoporin nup107 [Psilocybe cubensis]|uniref:Nuclear pore complex protein n=2 Tax=Psilocybe cubensis TaxID=181762 RepID=A0A8H7XP29_PSICU|nr:Nucleoporin nup107 [Psilocybe cubensis]KAH9475030.1 Nucleoporin nup107 [Psilocybe cubensis]
MAQALYSSYADVLSVCQTIENDLEAVLDPQTGYAPRMRQICQEYIDQLEDQPNSHQARHQIEVLRLEQNTWGLIQAVLPARITKSATVPTAQELLLDNPYTPPSTLAQAILNNSHTLKELLAVREWLQETAPVPTPPEANTGYWKFTKHTIMQGVRTGHGQREGLVSEMDPDAINRGDGAALAPDDASYEKNLLQALYAYVRAGRLEDAVEACRRAHQPWRASSIRGSLLFQWNALSTSPIDREDEDEEDEESISGNLSRNLWKSTCIRAALNPALSDHERVLFAAIAPSSQTSSILKSACRTWEDHLWAEINILWEEKINQELARLEKGSFWASGADSLDKGFIVLTEAEMVQREEEWEKEVTKTLVNLDSTAVVDGPLAEHAFHFSQLHIILDKTNKLLDTFAEDVRNGKYPRSSFEYDSMCRFFAHFCLFLQMIDIPVPSISTQTILETYLRVLEEAGQRELIALYAGALKTNAVERYADFLVSLMLAADFNERRQALARASEHGLDVVQVARVTAERSLDKAFNMLPQHGRLPIVTDLQPPPNEAETFLLRSIEWTTFREETYIIALEHATEIIRYFLCEGRTHPAQKLLLLLPEELAAIAEPEEMATEYMHYRQFFGIWDVFKQIVECQAMENSITHGRGASREEKARWIAEYRGLVDQAHDQTLKLLTTEWLVTEDDEYDSGTEAKERRHRDLIRIRHIFVPELIIKLHYALFYSRKYIPENLKRALELANVVADSRYNLFEDFVEGGKTIGDYLGAVRQAILAGLEAEKSSDPFAVITHHPNN